ncbi:Pentatricopeptide repeat-containing protein [Camellia lanceoleosa]|uniref:Pentatricopeptide repeat-containing protein n=1 Tax=Camellia lanceoleosa TaxID=1840588 RepID=A0ACC0FSR8_9ERIC|nr:Pentatricopeptide repeat-containing protein [Camellia lanceoleosa]
MMMLARNKIANEAKQVWEDLKREVLYDQHTFGDIIRAFSDSDLPSKAMDICDEMRQSRSFSHKWLFMTPLNTGLTINIGKGRVKRNRECCKFTIISKRWSVDSPEGISHDKESTDSSCVVSIFLI